MAENVLTRKIGPLATWGWIAIVGTVIVGWAWLHNRQSSAQSSPAGADASQVPQFVNQTFTGVQPPSAPPTPVTISDQDQDNDQDNDNDQKRPVRRKHPTHHRTTVPPASGNLGHLGGGFGIQHVPRGTVHKTGKKAPARRRG